MSHMMRLLDQMSFDSTNLCPSVCSEFSHTSMDMEATSEQAGNTKSVRQIGLPKSRTMNLLAPDKH